MNSQIINHFRNSIGSALLAAALLSAVPGAKADTTPPAAPHIATLAELRGLSATATSVAKSVSLTTKVRQPAPITTQIQLPASIDLTPTTPLNGHVAKIVGVSKALGTVDPSAPMTIKLYLTPSNRAMMDSLAQRLYDPNDAMYHQFLTRDDLIANFAPSQAAFNAAAYYLQKAGLSITDSMPDRSWIQAYGSAGQIESLFKIAINNYQAPDGSEFFSTASEPVLPQAIAPLVSYVSGLTNSDRPNATGEQRPAATGTPAANYASQLRSSRSTGGNGADALTTSDLWNFINTYGIPAFEISYAYDLALLAGNTPLNGAGQSVDLVEFSGLDPNDIAYYVAANNNLGMNTINAVPLVETSVDGGGAEGQFTNECEEDIEMLDAVAPGLSSINVYTGTSDGDMNDVMEQILYADDSNEVSSSYVEYELAMSSADEYEYDYLTEELALEGRAVFSATGDNGSTPGGGEFQVNGWAASAFETAVGGTTLFLNESTDGYYFENVWNNSYGASGGGESFLVDIPSYQSNYYAALGTTPETDPGLRSIPDVALDADPSYGYYAHVLGSDIVVGGTSLSTPIWAAYWAINDQWHALNGESNLGFANPSLYAIGAGPNYNNDFHDTVTGNNGRWSATTGLDPATGFGSMKGLNLLSDLTTVKGSILQDVTAPASAQSGQSITLGVDFDDPIPPAGNSGATVTWYYQQAGGSTWTPLASTTVPADGSTITATANVTMPDVPSNGTYYIGANVQLGIVTNNSIAAKTSMQVAQNLISTVTLNPAGITAGQTSTGSVLLDQPAAQNETIDLSFNSSVVSVPATVVIAKGSTSANFIVSTQTSGVTSPVNFAITASPDKSSGLGAGSQSASGVVNPQVAVTGLTLNPASIASGQPSTATVSLKAAAPAGGVTVTLSSPNIDATVPATVVVPAGATSAQFQIATTPVPNNATALITASANGSKATATLTLRAPAAFPSSITLNPATVIGGESTTATVTLVNAAPAGGVTATIEEMGSGVTVPATVTIPAGAKSVSFPIATTSVTATKSDTIIAVVYGVRVSTALIADPTFASNGLTLNPNSVASGQPSTATVTLDAAAPAGGLAITLSSSNPDATVPATVVVAGGATSAQFQIATTPVPTSATAVITASANGAQATATLALRAPAAFPSSIVLSPASVIGGQSTTATVTLVNAAPAGGVTVTIEEMGSGVTIPATVTIPAGAKSVSFTIATTPQAASESCTIIAVVYGVRVSTALVVSAPVLAANGVMLSPSTVIGGQSATGEVTLTGAAPTGGFSVSLSSSNAALATTSSSVIVPAGATSATFAITTKATTAAANVTFTASAAGGKQTAVLTVNP